MLANPIDANDNGNPTGFNNPGEVTVIGSVPARSEATVNRSGPSRVGDSPSRVIPERTNTFTRGTQTRRIEIFPSQVTSQLQTPPDTPSNRRTILDYDAEELFTGFWNQPVKGSGDKQGQFFFVPSATQSSGGGSILLLLGLAIVGGYAYVKLRG